MSRKENGAHISRKTRLICLIVCSVLLVAAIVGATYAWFRGVITAPGGTVRTAKISVSSLGYSVTGTATEDQSTSHTYSNIYKGTLNGTNTVEKHVENKVTAVNELDIVQPSDMYTALFVVKKNNESVDIDVQFNFTVKCSDEAQGDLMGFNYYLADVTDYVDLSGITLDEIADDNTPVPVGSELQTRFNSYLNGENGKLTENDFKTNPKYLANLGGDYVRATIRSGAEDYAVMRLSVKLIEGTEHLPQYTDHEYIINGNLTVAQVGALSEEGALGNTLDVHNLGELQSALKTYVAGDTIRILAPISVSGDINFPRPVTVVMVGCALTVRGNFRFTYAYEGNYRLDLSQSGQLIVASESGAGGNLYIDTPQSKVEIVGSGSTAPTAGDIYLMGDLRADVSFDEGRGLTVSRTMIYNTNTAETSSAGVRKGIKLMDHSRLTVSANSSLYEVEAYTYNDPSAATPVLNMETAILNYGEIGTIKLANMNKFTDEMSERTDHPQIYIENHSVVGMVNLPDWSVKWVMNKESGIHTGNTQIICYLGATLGVSCAGLYTDGDVERMGLDTDPIVPLTAAHEQSTDDNETTGFIVNYFVRENMNEQAENVTLEKRFHDWQNGADWTGNIKHTVNWDRIDYLEINCYGLSLTAEDYAYMQGVTALNVNTKRPDGEGFPNLVTLDLSGANSTDGITPSRAFTRFTNLQHIDLPRDTAFGTERVQAFSASAPINEMYLPETYTTVENNITQNIHYLHVQNPSEVVMLYDDFRYTPFTLLVPNEAMVQAYRTQPGTYYGNRYNERPWNIALEATHYGHYFANLNEASQTAQITAVDRYAFKDASTYSLGIFTAETAEKEAQGVNGVAFNFNALTIDGKAYTVTEFYSYAFYDMVKGLTNLTFSEASTLEIGNRAFYNAFIENLSFTNSAATVNIGEYAFYRASNVDTQGISGKVQMLGTVTVGAYAFQYNRFTDLTLNNATLGLSAMRYCNELKTLTVTGDLTTENSVFQAINSLTTVVINGNVNIGNFTFSGCPLLTTFQVDGEGEIKREAVSACPALVSAICPKVTHLGYYAFGGCSKLLVADFRSLTNAYRSFVSCTSLQVVRTGIITAHDNDYTDWMSENNRWVSVFGYTDPVKLHIMTAPATNEAGLTLNDIYSVYWTDANATSYKMRIPLPAWLYDLYSQSVYGMSGKWTDGRLNFAHNADNAGSDDWRYCRYQDGKLVECDPYELEFTDGAWALTIADYVFYSQGGVTKLIACVGDSTETWGDESTFTVPEKIQAKDGSELTVTVVGDGCFSLTAITQQNLVIPNTVTKVEDRAFYIMRSPTYRGGLKYNFTSVTMDGVETIGDEAFYVISYTTTDDVGFTTLSAKAVRTVGYRAFRNNLITSVDFPRATYIADEAFYLNDLYTINIPSVVEIGAYGFYNNPNLYAVYAPKFERENDTDVAPRGNQFTACPKLRYLFVGPLARILAGFFPDYAAVFIDGSRTPTTTAEFSVAGNGVQRYFLYYPEGSEGYDRYSTIASGDYTSLLVTVHPFNVDYIFGNQKGEEIAFEDLFKYETWAGEEITEDDRPSYLYRKSGDNMTLVVAHGKHVGEYRVPDHIGGETVDVIGWTYQTTGEGAIDKAVHYFDSAFSCCDLSEVTKLTFGPDISRIAYHGIGWLYSTNTYNLGRVSVNTNGDSCVVDLTGIEHIGNYAFNVTNVTEVKSDDVAMDFGTYCFTGCSKLREIHFPNAKTFGGGLLENGKIDTTREHYVFTNCAELVTVTLESAEELYGLLRSLTKVEKVSVPKLKVAQYSFTSCPVLTAVDLGTEVTDPEGIYLRGTFQGSTSLVDASVNIGSEKTPKVTFADSVFTGVLEDSQLSKLEHSVQYVTDIETGGLQSPGFVHTVVLPRLEVLGENGLRDNDNLVNVSLGGGTDYKGEVVKTEVMDYAFYHDHGIIELDLPYVNKASAQSFVYIENLTSLELIGIEELGDSPFDSNPNLVTVQLGPQKDAAPDGYEGFVVPAGVLSGTAVTEVDWPYATALADSAFYGYNLLNKASFERVKTLGISAMRGMANLASVNFPSATNVGQYAFLSDTALTSAHFPSVRRVEDEAFHGCTALTGSGIELGSEAVLGAGGVYIGEEAFWDATELGEVHWEFVTTMDQYHAFWNDNITIIDLPNLKEVTQNDSHLNTSPFETIHGLKQLLLPKLEVWPVAALHADTKKTLTTVDIGSLLEIPASAFSGCTVLTSVDAHSAVTVNNSVFSGCTLLETVDLSKAQTMGNDVFDNCTTLKSIELPELTSTGATPFSGCTALHTISAPHLKELPESFCYGLSALVHVTLTDATTVGNTAFNGCVALTEITLENATSIGTSCFNGCTELETITLPKIHLVGDSAFRETHALQTLTLGNEGMAGFGENEGIRLGSNVLWNSKLQTLDCPYVETLASFAFRNTRLVTVKLNGVKTVDVDLFYNETEGYNFEYFEMTSLERWSNRTLSCHKGLQTVIVPSLKNIPESFLSSCANLKLVDISGAVNIGNSAFYGCSALATLDNGTSKVETIGSSAFNGCAFTTIDLPNVQTISGSAFANTTGLNHITLGGTSKAVSLAGATIFNASVLKELNSEYVTSIAVGAFNGANITKLTLNGLETIDSAIFDSTFKTLEEVTMRSLKSMTNITFKSHANLRSAQFRLLDSVPAECFSGCNALGLVDIMMATSVGNKAFKDCTSLDDLTAMSLVSIGDEAFSGCTALLTKTIDTSDVQTIGTSAFYGCIGITTLSLPKVQTIGGSAFYGCSGLSSVTLGSADSLHDGHYVELKGSNIFYGCTSLHELRSDYVSDLSAADIFNGSSITTLVLNKNLTGVTIANALRYASKLEYVEMDAVTVFDTTNYFPSCKETLATLHLPMLKNIPASFMANAKALTEVDISGATNIGESAFSGCIQLATVKMGSAEDIGKSAFKTCTSLTWIAGEIDGDDFNVLAELMTLGGSAFEGCSQLVTISLPKIEVLDTFTFSGCTALSDVQIPVVTTIGSSAFKGCSGLKEIDLSSVETLSGDSNFQGSGLITVTLPKITTMGTLAFYQCSSLTHVVIGKNFQSMGIENFRECNNLTQLIIEQRSADVLKANKDQTLFRAATEINGSFKVLIHYDTYDAVKGAQDSNTWFKINFLTYFRPMEENVDDDFFSYYVSEIQTIGEEKYYEVVYIMPQEGASLTDSMMAKVPSAIEIDGEQYPIISVKPTAWSGLTEGVTEIVFPQGMTVFHTGSMLYIPATVAKFSISEEGTVAGDGSFKTIDGMLFDGTGETLLAVPKAYAGKDGTVVLGEGATANVQVISARAFYCSSITTVFVVDRAIYINDEAFAYSKLTDLWFTGKDEAQVSRFVGSDIFTGTSAKIHVYEGLQTKYSIRNVGSEYLLANMEGWTDGELPSYDGSIIPA